MTHFLIIPKTFGRNFGTKRFSKNTSVRVQSGLVRLRLDDNYIKMVFASTQFMCLVSGGHNFYIQIIYNTIIIITIVGI